MQKEIDNKELYNKHKSNIEKILFSYKNEIDNYVKINKSNNNMNYANQTTPIATGLKVSCGANCLGRHTIRS